MGYFKPLRRKFGVITLVMACVFAAGWVRSLFVFDVLSIDPGGSRGAGLYSLQSSLSFSRISRESPPEAETGEFTPVASPLWQSEPSSNIPPLFENDAFDWKWKFCGFGFGIAESPLGQEVLSVAPYWSIVIPLTLLSAYLLLSKPRKKPGPKAPAETTPEKVA